MRLAGRIQAAIEVLEDVLGKRTPVSLALRDWGKAHRFAGSKDRSAIGNYVHDALRLKSSMAWRMDGESPRRIILGTVVFGGHHSVSDLNEAFDGDKFAPPPLSSEEKSLLSGSISLEDAPDWVKADVPEWLWPAFENNFGENAVEEGQALTQRPPLDVRVNAIKTDNAKAFEILERFDAKPSPISPIGFRIAPPSGDGRLPNIQIEEIYLTGGVEIQDEGSQIVSQLINAQPGETVLDYCAGGGGKSLAIAGEMKNDGHIHAFDVDKRRLAPLYERATRAGATMVDVRQPPLTSLNDLMGKVDKVLIDAPCTGVGTWRRKPDAKWRLSEEALERRLKEQRIVLAQAKAYVRPGGLMFYVTCSMLAEENEGQVYQFLEDNDDFKLLSAGEVYEEKFGADSDKPWSEDGCTLTLTPASTKTDGFFFAVMEKQAG
ncbi:MAG: RsmB/NOP family class I SAM-dependent RNA methyltransferase [Alphaproteobacteria bacterium]